MSKKNKQSAAKPAQTKAQATVPAAEKRLDGGEVARITVILTTICIVITALLAGTNMLTEQKIAANAVEAKAAACREVLPAAQYIELDCGYDVYLAVSGSDLLGAVITTADKGYGGQIEVMVGVAMDGSVTGVNMLSHSETPGLGANSAKPAFLNQYVTDVSAGDVRPESFAVTKDGGQIDAVTAATISSRAVTRAVNTACTIFDELNAAGLLVVPTATADMTVSLADEPAAPLSGSDAAAGASGTDAVSPADIATTTTGGEHND